jgi:hypothetical protein
MKEGDVPPWVIPHTWRSLYDEPAARDQKAALASICILQPSCMYYATIMQLSYNHLATLELIATRRPPDWAEKV